MELRNHHGAPFGKLESDKYNHITFYPLNDWTSGYSAHQLEEIAKQMRKLE